MNDPTPGDLVVELLKTLDEALSDYVPWTDGGGVRLMPSVYREGSYGELEARLGDMRDGDMHREWWHVSARYLWGTIRRTQVNTRRTVKGRVPILPARCELHISGEVTWPGPLQTVQYYTWGSDVDQKLAARGIDHLVATMYGGDTTQLRLPAVFLWRMLGIERGEARVQPQQGHVQNPSLATT